MSLCFNRFKQLAEKDNSPRGFKQNLILKRAYPKNSTLVIKVIKRLMSYKKSSIYEIFFVSLSILLLVYLGFWQLSRLEEKNNIVSNLKDNRDEQYLNYTATSKIDQFAKLKLSGHFIPHKNIFLYGRKSGGPEKDGYYLLSPFETDSGDIILISRGWITHNDKNKMSSTIGQEYQENQHYQQHQEIHGIAFPAETKRWFVPSNDLKNNVWLTLNIIEAANYLHLNLQNFYLVELRSNEKNNISASIVPHRFEVLTNIRNDHLEYAATWFALAIILLIIFIVQKLSITRKWK